MTKPNDRNPRADSAAKPSLALVGDRASRVLLDRIETMLSASEDPATLAEAMNRELIFACREIEAWELAATPVADGGQAKEVRPVPSATSARSGGAKLRVLIADDHEIVRRGVREIIAAHPGWLVCAEAADGETALALATREQPDIAILDVSLPLVGGVMLTRVLKRESPGTRVLLFTMHDDEEAVSAGLAAGAQGYVLKTDSEQHLEAAIHALGARKPYFSSVVAEMLLEAAVTDRKRSRLESFTMRELEVAQLIAEGQSNKQVAGRLSIAVKTVESHRAAAMRKAGVRSAAEFVRFAIKNNLIRA